MSDPVSSRLSETSLPATTIPGLPDDWHLKATDQIIDKVDLVKQKTSGPAIGVARMVVYGVLAAIIAIMAVILFIIGFVRMLNNYLPSGVWLPYLILGAIFTLAGMFLWSKRPKGATA